MADNRTVEQRLAAVAASMTMAGYTMTEADRAESRRILRGEVSADESVRQVLADAGCDAADLVGKTAFRRLSELESSRPLTVFTRETLLKTHAYLCGDVYPWAGTIRTSEVGAMGLAMCRAAYVDQELDRLFRRIEQSPPSATDREAALNMVAEHWGELTIIHPFLDGNSRTQRYFFDHMLATPGGRSIGAGLQPPRCMRLAMLPPQRWILPCLSTPYDRVSPPGRTAPSCRPNRLPCCFTA